MGLREETDQELRDRTNKYISDHGKAPDYPLLRSAVKDDAVKLKPTTVFHIDEFRIEVWTHVIKVHGCGAVRLLYGDNHKVSLDTKVVDLIEFLRVLKNGE